MSGNVGVEMSELAQTQKFIRGFVLFADVQKTKNNKKMTILVVEEQTNKLVHILSYFGDTKIQVTNNIAQFPIFYQHISTIKVLYYLLRSAIDMPLNILLSRIRNLIKHKIVLNLFWN